MLSLVLTTVAVGLSVWAYPSLPDQVPTHWDFSGNVNGYSPRLVAVALLPVMMAADLILAIVLPIVSPRGFRLDSSSGAFYLSNVAIVATLLALHIVITRAQLAGNAPPDSLLFIPIGALLLVLGNVMGKLRKNFFIGIRTPWTLANDEVWLRTNRLAARLTVLAGLALIACSFNIYAAVAALLTGVAVITIVPAVYSYVLYRRLEGFGPNGN